MGYIISQKWRCWNVWVYWICISTLLPQKLPKLVEFVVESMKSLNMKLVSLKRKKSDQVDTEEHEQVDTEIEHGTTPQESDTPKHQDETLKMKPRSKYRKVLLDKNPPKLSKSTSIVDSDDFKPLISLKIQIKSFRKTFIQT